jgi:hypothetical protein
LTSACFFDAFTDILQRNNGTKNGEGKKDESGQQQPKDADKKNGSERLGSSWTAWLSPVFVGMVVMMMV